MQIAGARPDALRAPGKGGRDDTGGMRIPGWYEG
jgi:hypothetical protein